MDEEDEGTWTFQTEELPLNPPAWLAHLDTQEGAEDEARRSWVLFLYVAQCGWPDDKEILSKIEPAVKYLRDGPRLKAVK